MMGSNVIGDVLIGDLGASQILGLASVEKICWMKKRSRLPV
jgi:hypothetical protein